MRILANPAALQQGADTPLRIAADIMHRVIMRREQPLMMAGSSQEAPPARQRWKSASARTSSTLRWQAVGAEDCGSEPVAKGIALAEPAQTGRPLLVRAMAHAMASASSPIGRPSGSSRASFARAASAAAGVEQGAGGRRPAWPWNARQQIGVAAAEPPHLVPDGVELVVFPALQNGISSWSPSRAEPSRRSSGSLISISPRSADGRPR